MITMFSRRRVAEVPASLGFDSRGYTRSPSQDFRLFGPRPWKILATTYEKNGFLSNPDPGENLVSGNRVMETGCRSLQMNGVPQKECLGDSSYGKSQGERWPYAQRPRTPFSGPREARRQSGGSGARWVALGLRAPPPAAAESRRVHRAGLPVYRALGPRTPPPAAAESRRVHRAGLPV